YKRSTVIHDAADYGSRLAGISLPDHQRARTDGCRAGIGVVGHEPDDGRGGVGDSNPARAGDDVKEGFVGAAVEFEGCAAVDNDGGRIAEGSGEQAVGPASAELEGAGANSGAARPSGAGIVDDESSGAFLGE